MNSNSRNTDRRSHNGKNDDAPEDDSALFRKAMRGVKRLKAAPRNTVKRPKPKARARFTRLEAAAVLQESLTPSPGDIYLENGEEVSFKRLGIPDTALKKLRRGQYRIDAEVDLHGLNAAQARETLAEFLVVMQRAGAHCVRVVHGKGNRSGPRGPVLKLTVNAFLQKIDTVLAYTSTREVDGGTGALYVLLKR